MVLLYASPSSTISIPFPTLSPLKSYTSFLCYSTASSSSSSSKTTNQTPSSSSLSDQLLPLSQTLLRSQPSSDPPSLPTKPTWVNPSKPRPSVLSLHRHQRSLFSLNPSLRPLSELARSLRLSPDLPSALAEAFPPGHPPSRDDALFLLNSLRHWDKSLIFLHFLRSLPDFAVDTIFYNVVLKSLRSGLQWQHIDRLAREMVDATVPFDNITYSTIISAAKRFRRFDDALRWFERMYKTGTMPDEVSYSAVLDVYAQLGRHQEGIILYDRARLSGWRPDAVAFSVLAKLVGEAGDYDGIRFVLSEMKDVGLKPNLVVYNSLINATGKAGRPALARGLFEEMVDAGLSPNVKTLTSMIKIYGKAGWGRDALQLWERMKASKWPTDFILCNALLNMCADLGLEEEAEKLFDDMKQPGQNNARSDMLSYTSMIKLYAREQKPDKVLKMFEEMLQNGIEPNASSCTGLIQCLGKAGRIADAVRVFDTAMEKGLQPDDRLCGSLLSVLALCKEGEMTMVLSCLEKANSSLAGLLKMLGDEQVSLDEIKVEFRGIMNEAAVDVRRPFCNCLIDICRNQGFPSRRANELLYLGNLYGLYPGLHSRKSDEWSLNMRNLSVGAAETALEVWLKSLSGSVEQQEALPPSFSISTGSGTHKFAAGLGNSVASYLKKCGAPFQPNGENGTFVASNEDLLSWLHSNFSPCSC